MLRFFQSLSGISSIGHEDYKNITYTILKSKYKIIMVYQILETYNRSVMYIDFPTNRTG
jgi:hypothetical protein